MKVFAAASTRLVNLALGNYTNTPRDVRLAPLFAGSSRSQRVNNCTQRSHPPPNVRWGFFLCEGYGKKVPSQVVCAR